MATNYYSHHMWPAYSGLHNWFGPWIICDGFALLTLQVTWQELAQGPVGELSLQGSNDVLSAAAPGAETVLTIPTLTGIYGDWPTVAGVDGTAIVVVKNPLRFHRVAYDFDSGGALAQFAVTYTLK